MPIENGIDWRPIAPDKRGRHETFASAVDAVLGDLLTERNEFYDSIADNWEKMFPGLPARPGRFSDGKMFLYVRTAPTLFAMRPKLAMIRKVLAGLPNAPAKIDLRLEVHAE